MKSSLQSTLLALLLVASSVPSLAGRYPAAGVQTFTYADNTTALGDGTTLDGGLVGTFNRVITNSLQMSNKAFSANASTWKLPPLDSAPLQGMDVTFNARMSKTSASTSAGDGWALSFGAVPTGYGLGDLGYTMNGGLVLSFDTFANSPNDLPSIDVYSNNVRVGSFLATNLAGTLPITGGNFNLTNPATGAVSGNISYSASATTLQSALRLVNGWAGVVVTGSAGNWTVTMPANGQYADPVGNGANLTHANMNPGNGRVIINNTQDGTANTPEVWNITTQGRGFVFDATFRPVAMHWDYNGLDLTYAGQTIFTDLATPGFNPISGNIFALTSAISSTGAQDTYFDDFSVITMPLAPFETGGPIISEFMAENQNGVEDEDMDSPDWIEIYNGQNASVNMQGYTLTHSTFSWTFPSVSIPAYGHLVVYATGKNRLTNLAMLHTNFTLLNTGGILSLKAPAPGNAVVSTYTYPNQFKDVSYGVKYQGGLVGFLLPSTIGVGTQFSHYVAANGPAEDVVWSRDGGIITGATPVSITAPLAAAQGAVVRYTTDNSDPNAGSPLYSTTFNVTNTITCRARVLRPGYLPGDVSSRTFMLVDSSLTNYNGSGQPFKSHLPLIVFDSFGVPVDAVADSGQARPHRLSYSVVIDKDPVTGFADITSSKVDFQGRCGTHVRGDSSAGFAQKSYAWETWDNDNNDKSVQILGMPAESDWALHGPYTDKTFMRNFVTYSKMRELHGDTDGHAMRVRMVEVLFNQDVNQPVSYNDYRGVYILMERIKRGKDRINIAKLNSLATDPNLISGGYIFRRDRTSADGNTPLPVGMHSHTPNILNSAQSTYLSNYINSFNNALSGANFADPVLGYQPYIDTNSFIENWWFVEIAKQIDGYRLSTYFSKDRGGKIFATPIWDYNLSLGNADYAAGDQYAGWYWNQTDSYWWARLRQDPNYELKNWDRYWEMRKTIFNTASIQNFMEQVKLMATNGSTTPVGNSVSLTAGQPATLENAVMRHYRKYPVLGVYLWPNAGGNANPPTLDPRPWQINTTFQAEVDWMKGWLGQRLNWLDNQFFSGTTIYRPVVFSNAGGGVPTGTSLSIAPFTGTPPVGYSYASGGTIYYTTDGTDPRTQAPPVVENVLLSGTNNACTWLVPSANNGGMDLTAAAGANQWTGLAAPPNAAQWSSGVTAVGYDLDTVVATTYLGHIGGGSNTQTLMSNVNATCYIRVNFNIPDQATLNNIGTLKLGMKYEDGFRAYLNGVMVAGANDTDPSVTNSPGTASTAVVRDETQAVQFEAFDITSVGKSALVVGNNVIAIHGINAGVASSDFLISPRLTWSTIPVGPIGAQSYTAPLNLTTSTTVKARHYVNGQWSPLTSAAFIVNAVPASKMNTVISEVHYHPKAPTVAEIAAGFTSANDFEFIEILNVSNGNVDISNCRLAEGVSFNFGNSDGALLTLGAGERLLVVENVDAFYYRYGHTGVEIAGVFEGNLNNNGEVLALIAANGTDIARFTFGTAEPWPVQADGPGYSLVLNNPAADPAYTQGLSWRSSATIGGSPGTNNALPFTGSTLPTTDTDKDGFCDVLEYALGSSPTQANSLPYVEFSTEENPSGAAPGNYLVLEYSRNLAADSINILPERTTNLTAWSAVQMVYVRTENQGDGTARTVYRSADPMSAAARAFIHLRVTPVVP